MTKARYATTPPAQNRTRTALGLGTAATSNTVDFATAAQGTLAGTALQPGTLPLGTTLNATEANSLVTYARVNSAIATNPSGLRTTLGLGTAALAATTAFATAAQGTLAGTALQPGILPLGTTLNTTEANSLVTTARVQSAISGDIDGTKTILGVTNGGGIGGGVVEKFNTAGFSTIGANVYSVLIRYMYGGLTDAQLDTLFSYCASMGATTIRVSYKDAIYISPYSGKSRSIKFFYYSSTYSSAVCNSQYSLCAIYISAYCRLYSSSSY
jgi:hypothetical protein